MGTALTPLAEQAQLWTHADDETRACLHVLTAAGATGGGLTCERQEAQQWQGQPELSAGVPQQLPYASQLSVQCQWRNTRVLWLHLGSGLVDTKPSYLEGLMYTACAPEGATCCSIPVPAWLGMCSWQGPEMLSSEHPEGAQGSQVLLPQAATIYALPSCTICACSDVGVKLLNSD